MPPVRIVIADDHPLVRSGLRAVLLAAADLDVVGEAATGEEAVTLAASLQPDVIVMDLRMPGITGIEATRRIVQAQPHIRIVVLTLFEDDASLFAALRAVARGYILKDASEVEVVRAMREVGSGEGIFSPLIAQLLIAYFGVPPYAPSGFPFP